MTFHQFLLLLRARYKIALFLLLSTVGIAVALSLLLPKEYTATTSVMVDVKSPDPIAGMMLPALVMPGYMATQVDIINSVRVAQKVVKMLKLDERPMAREQWLEATKGKGRLDVWIAESLQRKLDAKPSSESSVLNIAYKAADPVFAAAVANAFAQAYINATIELKVEPAKQYAEWFGEQGKSLRDNLEKAQTKLSAYQQQHGIVTSDERLDIETSKLNELSTQLTIAQGETTDAQSKQRTGSASDSLPEIVRNPLIQNLKGELARQEAKLQEIAVDVGKKHPQYQRMESEIASLKQKLESETRHVASGFTTSAAVGKDREAVLRRAIDAQKRKILELRRKRDELAVLMRDVKAAQKAYEGVSQRFNQTRLESQASQTNVAVLTPASEPARHSFPKLWLNVLLALFSGTFLGVTAAFALETIDRRVRSTRDLAELLAVPVLGAIEKSKSRKRLGFFRAFTRALPAP